MLFDKPVKRVFGIDWLEVYANEEPGYDFSPDGFRNRGWSVEERGYGTKTMGEMFKLLDNFGHPFIEVRRAPRGVDNPLSKTVYKPGDCYIRFDNMYCYDANPCRLMAEFLEREHITFKKIFRIDFFIDLVLFDTNDKPKDVIRRMINHTYSKINQTQRRTSGNDMWEGCEDNWIAWGASGSMVGTKFYNKTKEIKDNKLSKPYIVEMWRQAGYIDNVYTISKDNTEVDVWRLEFSLKAKTKGWVSATKEEKMQGLSFRLPHNLIVYSDPCGVFNALVNLIPNYFRFKIYEEGKVKSQCKDKELFRFKKNEAECGYRLTSESDIDRVRSVPLDNLQKALYHLSKAQVPLSSTKWSSKCQSLIQELVFAHNDKSLSIYSKDSDVF